MLGRRQALRSLLVLLCLWALPSWAEKYAMQPGVAGTIRVVGSDTMFLKFLKCYLLELRTKTSGLKYIRIIWFLFKTITIRIQYIA